MKYNINKVIMFMTMVSYIDVLLSFGTFSQRQYSAPEIGRMGQHIGNEYINLSSADVFKRARTQRAVSSDFKVFLKDDEFMQKMKTIYVKGLDNASLSTISFKKDIDTDLRSMEALLTDRRDNLWIAKALAGVIVITGIGVGGGSTQMKRREQAPVAAIGGVISLLGGVGLWYLSYQKEYLDQHIKEVQEMDKDWRDFFSMNHQK